ncbi:NUDIX hydrolase [Zoogloea sp.]|jgi:8-oxo-dGTP diphosphatase|uniref:NUDIX hydrolase n=1 Tax=Zoogloea sp. TaxID=49181 RepID=UPI0037D9AA32
MAKERLNPSLRKAGVWAIIQCADTGKVLLGKRSSVVNNGGAWNFFGGRVDRGESPRTALLRELVEEAGLRVKEKQLVKLGRVFGDGVHGGGDRELHYYLLRLEREVVPRLNREHSNFGWFKPGRLPARFNRPTTIAIKKGLLGSLRQH